MPAASVVIQQYKKPILSYILAYGRDHTVFSSSARISSQDGIDGNSELPRVFAGNSYPTRNTINANPGPTTSHHSNDSTELIFLHGTDIRKTTELRVSSA